MKNVIIIGIGNKARQGKDSLADILRTKFLDARIYSMADDLKAYCRIEKGMTSKDSRILQFEGERFRRERGPDFWWNLVRLKIEEYAENRKFHVAIIPDMRYKNEKSWIESEGGITVKVDRLNPDGTRFIDPHRAPDHISEIELDNEKFNYHYVIESGNFAALYSAADELVNAVKSRTGDTTK